MDISILDKEALIILVSIPENHSQLLRPSYTPKSNDYGIDRVRSNTGHFYLCFTFKPQLNISFHVKKVHGKILIFLKTQIESKINMKIL